MASLKANPETQHYASKKHLHTYERSKTNKKTYRCIDPRCTHYRVIDFLLGKIAACPKCGGEFILDRFNLRNKLPTCFSCSKSPKAKLHEVGNTLMDELMNEITKSQEDK